MTAVLLIALWLLPLAGAVALWTFGPQLRERAGPLGGAVVFASFVLAVASVRDATTTFGAPGAPGAHAHVGSIVPLASWVPGLSLGLQWDPLSLLWTLIVTGIGFLIHVYSVGYMAGDRAFARFFAYLNFFVFAMLTLVLADGFPLLLVGWGLVGLASYFLIGFWLTRPSAVAAARKAFVINVVGDVGLMFALFVLFAKIGSLSYVDVFANVGRLDAPTLFVVCCALFVACAAKSAQVPLHSWLPDAMEGPTPVSALIHAATMVTAGVYLIARCAPLWSASPQARELVGVVGALTALAGAILGITQWDIKRILAYSTMSQIGYMIMGVGVGAYGAGVFHFFTHAFFKAQLFLASGIVIHALHDEQDVRRMGALRTRLPFAFAAMLLGTIAITGILPIGGFWSKDALLYGVLSHGHPYLYAVGVATAGITAYYMFRMIFLAFFGSARYELGADVAAMPPPAAAAHAPEAHAQTPVPDWIMQAPVAVLMVGTFFGGFLGIGGERSPWTRFLAPLFPVRTAAPSVPTALPEIVSTLIVLAPVVLGALAAYARYGRPVGQKTELDRLHREARDVPRPLARLYYVDDALGALVVRPARALGDVLGRIVDPRVIDGLVRDVAWFVGFAGLEFRTLQNGFVRSYALTIVGGAACFVVYYTLLGVGR